MIVKKRKMHQFVEKDGQLDTAEFTQMYLVHAPWCVTCVP